MSNELREVDLCCGTLADKRKLTADWEAMEKEIAQLTAELERVKKERDEFKETARQYTNLASKGIYHSLEELAQRDIEQLNQFTNKMLHAVANQFDGFDDTPWSQGCNHVFRLFGKYCCEHIKQLRAQEGE